MHERGIQLVPELLLLASDTLYTQGKHIRHLHKISLMPKNQSLTNGSFLNITFFSLTFCVFIWVFYYARVSNKHCLLSLFPFQLGFLIKVSISRGAHFYYRIEFEF